MPVATEDVVAVAKAIGDPSRVRILAILDQHELTVSELVLVLGQSQPRVSRHLKLLHDAGLLRRKAEGRAAFFRLDRTAQLAPLARAALDAIDADDPELAADARRLQTIRDNRARTAAAYFEDVATSWDAMRHRHVADSAIEHALLENLRADHVATLLDLGTGTGRILEIAGPHIDVGLGIDRSRDMLAVARHKLEGAGLHHCEVRHGDVHNVGVPAGTVDMAVLHHVLHFLDDPGHAIAEAARTLRPGGRLLVVDFQSHGEEMLRTDYQHQRLGFDTDEVDAWCREAGLSTVTATAFTPETVDEDTLTVVLWAATQRSDAPSTYSLEVA